MTRPSHLRVLPFRTGLLLLILCAALAPPSLAQAQEKGRCISADVDSTVVLPDGSRHEAGSLRICVDRIHSPVTSLHNARVDGRNVGLYSSRSAINEERAGEQEPYMLFRRAGSGDLVLQGYAVPEGNRMRTFLMARPDGDYDL